MPAEPSSPIPPIPPALTQLCDAAPLGLRECLGLLERLDGDALDAAVGAWLADRLPPQAPTSACGCGGRQQRTRRGRRGGRAVHLLAAMDHTDGAVLGQRQVDDTTKEISGFQPLLAGLDPAGVVVTADAVHTQGEAAEFLVTRKQVDYRFIVKGHQPGLDAQRRAPPWREISVLDRTRDMATAAWRSAS